MQTPLDPILAPLVLSLAGGFGGLFYAIRSPVQHHIFLPFCGHKLVMGALGDVLIGMGAALGMYAFYALFPNGGQRALEDSQIDFLMRFAGLGMIAGYAGGRLLDQFAEELLKKKLQELQTKQDTLEVDLSQKLKVSELIGQARAFIAQKQYHLALGKFDEVLVVDPTNTRALVGKAATLNWINPKDHELPLTLITRALELNVADAYAYYKGVHQIAKHGRLPERLGIPRSPRGVPSRFPFQKLCGNR